MKRLLISRTIGVLIFILCAGFMHAQSITINGKVVDATNNSALTGVNVVVQGTQSGTVTDIDGNYSIDVEPGKVLDFSMIGYIMESIEVTAQTVVNVTMVQDITQLDEIVVIGYGTQRKVDLTGAVVVVDAEEMKKVSHSNISTMLQGKAAGVQITTDGQPGADPSVRIRGIATFGDASPLYVVDGVPVGTTIRDFSPNDIESLQILKDASAAAIYGSRAANGVVIITTKQGKKNQAMKIDYKGYVGIDKTPSNVYDVMNSAQYGEYLTMSYDNYNLEIPSGYDPTNDNYIDPNEVNTNWFDEVYKTGTRQNHNINLSGGGENNTYNVALDYYSQEGTMKGAGPNFDRYTARFNNTMDVKFLKFKTNVVYSHSDQDNMGFNRTGDLNQIEFVQGLYGAQYPVMASALLTPPSIKAYDESTWVLDDKISAASGYTYDSYGYGTYYDEVHGDLRVTNVLLTNNLLKRNTTVDRVVASGSAIVDFLDMVGFTSSNHSFNYTLNLSYSKTYANDLTFVPSFIQSTTNYLSDNNETLRKGVRNYGDALVENTLNYDGKFGLHHVNVVVGQTYQRETFTERILDGIDMPEPFFLQIDNAAETKAESYESEHMLASYIGRILYDFDKKYLFSATVRRDGSSRFAPENNIGVFPSVSAGWRIEREDFFPVDKSIIGLFKVRASYGELGNENIARIGVPYTSEYQYVSGLQRGNYTYSFGNTKVTGSSISTFVNTAIMWETKKTTDIGFDLAMFRNKLEFTFDWYKSISENLLYEVDVPSSAGVDNETVVMNAATMENSGLEFLLAYHNHDGAVKYDISANFSTLKNKVTKLGVSGEPRTDRTDFRTEVGSEVGQFYGYVLEDDDGTNVINGIAQNPGIIDTRVNDSANFITQDGAQAGDLLYKDLNNDGTITAEDRQILGSGIPDFSYGFNVRVEWNGIDLSIATYGAAGFQAVDYVQRELNFSYGTNNKDVALLNAWTPTYTNTDVPRVAYRAEGSVTNDVLSERFLQNASYLKIANIELGYNLPDKLFGGYVVGIRLYVSAQNLATFSKYEGYNVDFRGGTFTPGYNYASYPTPRSFMFGLQASF